MTGDRLPIVVELRNCDWWIALCFILKLLIAGGISVLCHYAFILFCLMVRLKRLQMLEKEFISCWRHSLEQDAIALSSCKSKQTQKTESIFFQL